jgi:hypothetical protein
MAFAIHCPCGQRLEVTEGMAGTAVPCPCGSMVRVPSFGELRRLHPQSEEPPDSSEREQAIAQVVSFALAAVVFVTLTIVEGLTVANGGWLSVAGYGIAMCGQLLLLFQIVRVCSPSAIVLALLLAPFFSWYYAFRRWDLAKWPFLCNVGGLVIMLFGFKDSAF